MASGRRGERSDGAEAAVAPGGAPGESAPHDGRARARLETIRTAQAEMLRLEQEGEGAPRGEPAEPRGAGV